MEAFVDIPWAPTGRPEPLAFGAPREVIAASSIEQVRPALDRVAAAAAGGAYAVGYVSYEAAPAFDPAMRVRTASGMPLVWFGIHDNPLAARRPSRSYACARWEPGTEAEAYAASVAKVRAAIARGETYQVNHTMRLRSRLAGDAWGAFDDLRAASGRGWFGYLDLGSHAIASVSPELFFTWDGQTITTRPMKGTRARHTSPDADDAARTDLASSPKDRAENLMIVDLLRNDVARICEPGSVTVPSLFDVEEYPTVWQLTSTVTGRTRSGMTLTSVFDALFPCGSITGAPKVRTMSLIADFEDRPRGVYCGAVGIVFPGGAAAFNVAIRTLVVDWATGKARYDVGGGVVWDSTGADEYAEALAKARVLDRTQREFELIATMRTSLRGAPLGERQVARLRDSAAWFGWPLDVSAAQEWVRRGHETPARLRLLAHPDGSLTATCSPIENPPFPSAPWDATTVSLPKPVALASHPVWSGDPWLRHKTTERAAYERAWEGHRGETAVFDVLVHNERGELTEFTIGNLVAELDGTLVTPPVECGLLAGTARAEALAAGMVVESVVRLEDVSRYSRMWLLNAVRGWVPVRLVR